MLARAKVKHIQSAKMHTEYYQPRSARGQTKDPHDMGMIEFEQMLQLELANAERILQYEATEPAAVIPLPRSLVNSVTCVMTSEHCDLFEVGADYALCHCISKDLKMSSGIAVAFKDKFGGLAELRRQCLDVGDVGVLRRGGRYIYYLGHKGEIQRQADYERSQCRSRGHARTHPR